MESENPKPGLKRVKRSVIKETEPMESSKEHFERQQPTMGTVSDLKRVKKNSAATVAELREFLGQLKGRSPQEVMGIVAQSSLIHGVTTATIGSLVLLIACTVIPYAIYGGPAAATPAKPVVAAVSAIDNSETRTKSTETPESSTVDGGTATSTEPDLAKAAEAMGIDKTATADPGKNPLDSKLDKLLDRIE